VASSLDGCIAGPNGEYDWIPMDPDIDFAALYAGFSAIVMGRRAYEVFSAEGTPPAPKMPVYVYSRTVSEGTRKGVTFARDAVTHVRSLKAANPGATDEKPLWLWGGGELFRSLADAGEVDGVDVAVLPIVLGGGIQLMPTPGPRLPLRLTSHRVYPKTGTLFLEYEVVRGKTTGKGRKA
jgi:dihydrofolate reductase